MFSSFTTGVNILWTSADERAAALHATANGSTAVAYTGMMDCFAKTVREEGVSALFKVGVICRCSCGRQDVGSCAHSTAAGRRTGIDVWRSNFCWRCAGPVRWLVTGHRSKTPPVNTADCQPVHRKGIKARLCGKPVPTHACRPLHRHRLRHLRACKGGAGCGVPHLGLSSSQLTQPPNHPAHPTSSPNL
eukprot:scaffold90413_cov17-Tisochrysis_lutea.AAC.1